MFMLEFICFHIMLKLISFVCVCVCVCGVRRMKVGELDGVSDEMSKFLLLTDE